jgi:hypothetical protein
MHPLIIFTGVKDNPMPYELKFRNKHRQELINKMDNMSQSVNKTERPTLVNLSKQGKQSRNYRSINTSAARDTYNTHSVVSPARGTIANFKFNEKGMFNKRPNKLNVKTNLEPIDFQLSTRALHSTTRAIIPS